MIKIRPISSLDVATLKPITGANIVINKPVYNGPYEATPGAHNAQILQTKDKRMINNVTIKKIPYYETSNVTGKTVYIGSEV